MRFLRRRVILVLLALTFVLVVGLSILYFIGRARLEASARMRADLTQKIIGESPQFSIKESVLAAFSPAYKTIPVVRVDITESCTMVSRAFYQEKHELRARLAGEVKSVLVNPGDRVAAGQQLAVLHNESALPLLAQAMLDYELQQARLGKVVDPEARAPNPKDVETLRLRVQQAELALDLRRIELAKLVVTAPRAGRLISLKVDRGDYVVTGQVVATLLDDSKIIVQTPFPQSVISDISVGMTATVAFGSNLPTAEGVVTAIASEGVLSGRASFVTVSVETDNQSGHYKSGMLANVSITASDGTLIAATGTCAAGSRLDVKSLATGVVSEIHVKEQQPVVSGASILTLSNKSYDLAVKQAETDLSIAQATLDKLTNPETVVDTTDIAAQRLRLLQAELTLETRRLDVESLVLVAPIDGVVTRVPIRRGDKVQAGAVLLVVQDDSKVLVQVSIPELYARKVELGQQADVVFDSFPDKSFIGRVVSLDGEGQVRDKMSAFDAIIQVDKPQDIRPGMTAKVTLTTEIKEGVLAVPQRLIMPVGQDKAVTVLREDKKDFWRRKMLQTVVIETGISDGIMCEIRCGLEAGDELVVPETK